jgi:hypothetical protein
LNGIFGSQVFEMLPICLRLQSMGQHLLQS